MSPQFPFLHNCNGITGLGPLHYTVSVLGQEEGYTVKYTPPPEGVPEGVYPESSPNTDIISF